MENSWLLKFTNHSLFLMQVENMYISEGKYLLVLNTTYLLIE